MKKTVYILGFLFCVAEVDAQVIMVTPDSLTTYKNSQRYNEGNTIGEPTNPSLRIGTPNKEKGKKPINGKVTVLYDPLDPTKTTLVLKTIPN